MNRDITRHERLYRDPAHSARPKRQRGEEHSFHALGGNLRDVWIHGTTPYKGAHFAVFPPALITPCVLAGSSATCCLACGTPWQRQTDRRFSPQVDVSPAKGIRGAAGQKPADARNRWGGSSRGTTVRQTREWLPACACGAETAPSVVLDPFCGSGTTGVVALRHGRAFLGIDLNLAYLDLARSRIEQSLATPTPPPRVPTPRVPQRALFPDLVG